MDSESRTIYEQIDANKDPIAKGLAGILATFKVKQL
jgi:hypothetical protein